MTGDQNVDFFSLRQWTGAFFQNLVAETGLGDPNKQFVPDAFDPANLPDPTRSTIANSQQTANQAYTAAQAAASSGTGLQANIDAETAARTAADATLTTNLATETTNRTNADATLTTNLANEVTNRTNADAALALKDPFAWTQGVSSGASPGATVTFSSTGAAAVAAFITARSFTGSPPDGAFIIQSYALTSTSLSFSTRAAPGVGNSVTFDVCIFKTF